MPISRDQSRFTSCVVGEASPADQSAFNAALLNDAALREEAVILSRTAHRLATALKNEPALVLTAPQRHRVFRSNQAPAATPARKPARPAWFGPTLATTAIAASIVAGLISLPGRSPHPAAGAPAGASGIPSIAMDPATPDKSIPRPVGPPPTLTALPAAGGLPAPTVPESPARIERLEAMAATPPSTRVVPPATPATEAPVQENASPRRPLPGQDLPEASFASPLPGKP